MYKVSFILTNSYGTKLNRTFKTKSEAEKFAFEQKTNKLCSKVFPISTMLVLK